MTGKTAEAAQHMQRGRGIVRTYRRLLLRRVLVTIFLLAVVLGLMAIIDLVAVNNEGPLPVSKIAGLAVLGALALAALWLILFELACKVTLIDDTIAWSLFGWEQVLARADIAGRREARGHRGQRLFTIVPIDPRTKPLKLPPHLATDAAFEAWIAALRDLNAEDLNGSEARILDDRSHGATPQERLARLAAARTLVYRLNMATTIVAIWCVIAPWPSRRDRRCRRPSLAGLGRRRHFRRNGPLRAVDNRGSRRCSDRPSVVRRRTGIARLPGCPPHRCEFNGKDR